MSSSTSTAPKPEKFLFDTRFDVASGAHNIDDELPRYNALEMDKARAESFVDGQETGYKKAIESIEHDISVKLEVLSAQIKEVLELQQKIGESLFKETLKVSLLMAQRILPTFYEKAAKDEVETVVNECFSSLLTQSRVVIHVNEKLVKPIQERASKMAEKVGFDGRISVLADDEIDVIDCSVEWAEGGVHKVTRHIWQNFEAILARYGVQVDGAPKIEITSHESADVVDDVPSNTLRNNQEPGKGEA